MKERARGALLGLAVGDALGTTYEFARIEQPDYPTLATVPARDVVGGGPFNLVAGQITDDTQLAVCLARSLHESKGALDTADVARRYVAWMDEAFDIGTQTRAALARHADGDVRGGLTAWRELDRRPAGNGSLMRTAPLAVAYARRHTRELIDAAMAESAITHADPRCMLACAAFDAAIARAVARGAGASDMHEAAIDALRFADPQGFESNELPAVERARTELLRDLEAARDDNPGVYGSELHVHKTAGFVRVAFRLAFWHLLNTPSWRDAVVDTASRGGDADTNAAIVGALLGARDGVSAIPAAWAERVLGATQPGSTGWADAHHPRHLLALAE